LSQEGSEQGQSSRARRARPQRRVTILGHRGAALFTVIALAGYAQFIPGVNTGRGIGLIETRGFTRVVDAIGLLDGSAAWRAEDDHALHDCFSRFLAWMQESSHDRDEAAAKNNHGMYYDLQVVSFALYLDRRDVARDVVEAAKEKRLAVQIEPDGRHPAPCGPPL
jgi:Alginate lyase